MTKIKKYQRHSIRLPEYDYSKIGGYFITLCIREKECLLGEIVDGNMVLNDIGKIVDKYWNEIPEHFPHVELDEYIVMPNHVHGIVMITTDVRGDKRINVGARHAVPLQSRVHTITSEQFGKPVTGSIPTIVRSFKSAVTKRINELRRMAGIPIWQRNLYEHVIRGEWDLNRIRKYIINNPANWDTDTENTMHRRGDSRIAQTRRPQ